MQISARASRIHDKPRAKGDAFAILLCLKNYVVTVSSECLQPYFVDVINAEVLRLLNEEPVEVSAEPVCIRDFVVGACCYKELITVLWIECARLAERMVIK